ncbi:hypothetical protein V5739_14470 [Salinimicrobium sp. TIG7-5_MAKvit]|uniref:hypothetical protein n=1 Tax=Salinimicrobium sp. TIG7-5_MAKvit TaxID=3121289 RepID=UPI003C6DC49A
MRKIPMQERLFIIKNNTHYLNVKNYIKAKPMANNYIFLTIGKFKGYQNFIETIKNDHELELFGIIFTNKSSRFKDYWKLMKNVSYIKKHASKHKHFDEIIFTNYKFFLHHSIINHFNFNKIVLLSDGAGIIVMANYRKNHNSLPLHLIPLGRNKFLRERILKIKPIERLHFYTQIKLDIAEWDSQEIFKFETSKIGAVNSKKVYFVGSPMVELGFIDLNTKIKYLEQIFSYYKEHEVYYFPHRRESNKYLECYSFMQIMPESTIPFEKRMELKSELPGTIISFVSSVIINLAPIYPNIKFLYFPLSNLDLKPDEDFRKKYGVMIEGFESLNNANFSKFPREK